MPLGNDFFIFLFDVAPIMHIAIARSSSNPMDKGACNSIHYQYYRRNSNMASSVTMYISFLHTQGYTAAVWAATPSSCVKVTKLLRGRSSSRR